MQQQNAEAMSPAVDCHFPFIHQHDVSCRSQQQREESVPAKVWTTLITNMAYLPGLLTLDFSLKAVGSQYPLVALTTDTFPAEGYAALTARRIPWERVPYLLPSIPKEYTHDPRFYDCWSKLTPFGLTQYQRVIQLDSDMLVLQNMDELMDMELDGAELQGGGRRVFAASHACVCNPLRKPHYPKEWTAANCAFTTQHHDPQAAQHIGAAPQAGLGMPNGGLQVVVPCQAVYDRILDTLKSDLTMEMDFADQSLLSQCFAGRWVALPYVYNALKTLRWKGVHDVIWKDDQVKNVHLLLSPKPWEEKEGQRGIADETHKWWWQYNDRRIAEEKTMGINDGF